MWRQMQQTVGRYWPIFLLLIMCGCTDRIESTLPPTLMPTPPPQGDIPIHLRNLYADKCANCHGDRGQGNTAVNIFRARARSPRNWAQFLKNPQGIEPGTRQPPIKDLSDVEYAAFGEWLARITKDNNRPPRSPDNPSVK